MEPVNTKVRFGNEMALLETADSRVTLPSGVEIWMKRRPGGEFQPMATIPDGMLEQYKHCRPTVDKWNWKK